MQQAFLSDAMRRTLLHVTLATALALPMTGAAVAQAEALACQRLVETLTQDGRVALQGVEFDFNRATLRVESLAALVAVRDAIGTLGGNWQIEGHTDNRGPHDYNLQLSQARAQTVRDWLVGNGIPATSLHAQGFSFDRPVASNETDEGRARNRRVEVVGAVTPDMPGFGGPEGVDPCPSTLTPGTSAQVDAGATPPSITEWTGSGGQEWLPFSLLMPTGDGAAQGWAGDRRDMPPGSQPQACQSLCQAEAQCAAFSFEPAGSFFVENARCALIGYGTELDLQRDNGYFDGGTYFASGLKPDARILTPESEAQARAILDDMAEIAALRAGLRLIAPEEHTPEGWMEVALEGAVPAGLYPSYLEIAELQDYAFDWTLSRSSLLTQDMTDGRTGLIWTPEPGDYTLRYVISHPTAGTHTVAQQLLVVRDGAVSAAPSVAAAVDGQGGLPSANGEAASLNFSMVVAPGAAFEVRYHGPLHSGDWIDIITPGNDEDMSGGWGWAWATGDAVLLSAPEEGSYLVRYVAEDPQRGRVVLAAEPLVVQVRSAAAPAGPDSAVPVATGPVAHACIPPVDAHCVIELQGLDLTFSLMPGYGVTAPEIYVTAAGVAAARPTFELVRLSDNGLIASVNPRQATGPLCLPGALDLICATTDPQETDTVALFALVGSLGPLNRVDQSAAKPAEATGAEPGALQGVWWLSIDMPGTADHEMPFAMIGVEQAAGDLSLSGTFITAPDLGPLHGQSGVMSGAIAGETLNLSLPGPEDATGLVFTGTAYGADAFRGQVFLAHAPLTPPTGAFLIKRAGPGEDWDGPPWMRGQPEGMEAALDMGRRALAGLVDQAAPEDQAMVQMMGQMLGAMGMQSAAPLPVGGVSPQIGALGGVVLDIPDLSPEAFRQIVTPHLGDRE